MKAVRELLKNLTHQKTTSKPATRVINIGGAESNVPIQAIEKELK